MFCKHDWTKVNEFETEGIGAIAIKYNCSVDGGSGLFRKKYITDYTCVKCGKLKRFVVKN